MLLSGATSLGKLLQIRPAAVEILESLAHPFWDCLDKSLEEFCRDSGLDPVALLKKIGNLPTAPRDSNWGQEPLYQLLDYLTADHRRFLQWDLPEISHLLDLHNIPVYPDGYVLKLAFQSYQAFDLKFREHLREEEEHVFPHILRLEACSRDLRLNPRLHRGAVGVFAGMQGHPAEEELKRSLAEIREKVHNHRLQEPTATVTDEVYRKLEELENRLVFHAALEIGTLFPRAVEIEKRLMAREFERQREALPFTAPA